MAEHTGPGTLGSTPGTTGTADNSTQSNNMLGRVREQAAAQLDTQKGKATDGLGSVAQAVRQTIQHLRDEKHDTVARYAEQAADQIERFSQRLKDKDVGELMNDAQQLARRQPALFVGGAFTLGLLGARFLKSSSQRSNETYRTGEYAARGYEASGVRPTSNAYGNRVPTSGTTSGSTGSRSGSVTSRGGLEYPPTEGL